MKTTSIIADESVVNREQWSSFLKNHPNGNIFQSPELFDAYQNIPLFQPVIIVAVDGAEMVGCLMAVIQKGGKGIVGRLTARSVVIGGSLAKNNNLEVINLLLHNYNLLTDKKVVYSQFRNLFDLNFASEAFASNGYEYEKHLDILIDLTQPKDVVFRKISKNKRRNVTKSTNKGVIVCEITDKNKFQSCINLIHKTYKRVGIPCPSRNYYNALFDKLTGGGILKVFAAEINGRIIGTRLVLCYGNLIYDWWAGADDKFLKNYPNDMLLYRIIEWGNRNGFGVFDFGGAGKPGIPYGVRDYKMRFGGELVEFGRFLNVRNRFLYNVEKFYLEKIRKIK